MATSTERDALRIGELAERTGTNTPTIRYYEEVGLLPHAARQAGGQRRYGEADVERLQFIRRCREFGFPLEQVRDLVSLFGDSRRNCTDARDIAQAHLTQVRAKMTELRALERDIAAFVHRCNAECVGGPGPDCVPLVQLAAQGRPHRTRPTRRVHA